jgi:ornithine decarboxylase
MKNFWKYLKKYPDRSVYHYQPLKVESNWSLWKQKFPSIAPHYAIKSNDYPKLVEKLWHLGCSFDCASQKEIKQVLSLSAKDYVQSQGLVSKPKIVFANPVKMPSHLQYAKKHDVALMTVDSVEELRKIAYNYPLARLILRIAVDDSQSICQFNKKYGLFASQYVPFFENYVSIKKRLENSGMMNPIPLVGLSFHVGSGCLSANSYRTAIKMSHDTAKFARLYGQNLDLLDIGGGFIQKEPLLTDVSQVITRELEIVKRNWGVRTVIAEPGRFLSANVFDLYVTVIGKKKNGSEIKYYINDSVYGSFNCKIFDYATFQFDIYRRGQEYSTLDYKKVWRSGGFSCATFESTIFGATCDSLDVVMEKVMIPELYVGDVLRFHEMGAYTYSASSQFNGIQHPLIWVGVG